MSASFSSEIPTEIMNLQKPLFPDQPDKEVTIKVSAGSVHEHSIHVTVCFDPRFLNRMEVM